jgi:hypothetical protein
MKLRDRLANWLALKLGPQLPPLQKLARKLNDAVEVAKEERREIQEIASDLAIRKMEAEERLQMLKELRMAEALCRTPDRECRAMALAHLPESERAGASDVKIDAGFKERLWELELALEDRGWVRETTLAALEFSRYGVQQLIRICRVYGIKNPIIKRIAEICKLYVFGRGIEIRSEDDAANKVIKAFLEANDAEMGHNGLADKETDFQTDGALYFGLATDNGGNVRVIMVDPLEIMDVVCDPDDLSKPLWFKRQWNRLVFDPVRGRQTPEPLVVWYPSLETFNAGVKPPQSMGEYPVNPNMPILRIKGGCPSKWRWGVPPVYSEIDWARAYKDALEDYATVRRTLARFALMVETKGGPGAIAAYQSLLTTTFADNSGTQIERNPPPVVASAHIGGPGTAIQAFKSSGAQSSPEETRRLLLMACAGAGMPETFFGDASTGSLATAVSLDRPTELKFTSIQKRWIHTIKMILKYVLVVSRQTPGATLFKLAEAKGGKKKADASKGADLIVKFPTVVEHQIQPMIQAITEIASLGGRNGIAAGIVDRRTICSLMLEEIGYERTVELLDKIYGKDYDPADDVTDQRSQVPPQALTQPTGKPVTDLSTPPPLPPPPAPALPVAPPPPAPGSGVPAVPAVPVNGHPAPPKPGAKPGTTPTKKESLVLLLDAVKEAAAAVRNHA